MEAAEQIYGFSWSRTRGHGSNSCGGNLMVQGCTWTEETFYLLDRRPLCSHNIIRDSVSGGCQDCGERVTSFGQRRIPNFGHRRRRDKCVLDTSRWMMKFGKVPGSNNYVEKEFKTRLPSNSPKSHIFFFPSFMCG
jgi:hypothetical protein